ncbi:MAG: DNA-binding response regulator [Flavobacteriaceae bacterium]|uniref:response regulator n=1 Tax=Leeuwenhoekiella sp. UBA1003 TaxID=1946744 RepID=UPI000C8C288D|nr:response regulator transcription factor [Leeuwenhoekiella sp. UBA1003]MAT90101.1 DNA-binding response regulator [Flavobacteriaceae bacterium]
MNQPSIITADDHPLLLKGLNDFLLEKKHNLIGSASNGREAFQLIVEKQPEIAVLDIQMPGMSGIDVARKVRDQKLSTKIVFITFHKEKELYDAALELNVCGYILKEFAIEEIETCIQNVSKDQPFFSPKIKELLGADVLDNDSLTSLTPSEKKILKLIASDKTNREIASILFISHRTVEKHRSNIINKLQLEPKTNSLLIWAKENHGKLI